MRSLAFLLLTFSIVCFAQAPQIKSASTVYIEPMEGYETYLAAAFTKKHVPLVFVTDRAKADYIITSTVSQRAPSQPAVVINNTNNVNGKFSLSCGGKKDSSCQLSTAPTWIPPSTFTLSSSRRQAALAIGCVRTAESNSFKSARIRTTAFPLIERRIA